MANGSAKREEPTMTFSRKDVSEARNTGGNVTNKDGKMQNGMQLRTTRINLWLLMLKF